MDCSTRDEFLTVSEVAGILKTSRDGVYRLRNAGYIEFVLPPCNRSRGLVTTHSEVKRYQCDLMAGRIGGAR